MNICDRFQIKTDTKTGCTEMPVFEKAALLFIAVLFHTASCLTGDP